MTVDPRSEPLTSPPHSQVLAELATYPEAQSLVDRMSDAGFPVQHLRIVGTGLRTVEQVTGRLTKWRAALGGAASGAWFGLLIGLLLGLFADVDTWGAVVVSCVLIGVFWGAVFGFVAHWATRGQRDFSSIQGIAADRYEVEVDAAHAVEARRMLAQQHGGGAHE